MLNKKHYLNEEKGIAAFSEYIQKEISKVEKSIDKSLENPLYFERAGNLGSLMYCLAALKAIKMALENANDYIPEDEQYEWIQIAVTKHIKRTFSLERYAVDGIMWFCEQLYFKKMSRYF